MKLRLVITELSINPVHLPRTRQEAEVPESDAAENEKPGTDAPMVETPETSMEESGVTEPETGSGIPDQETEERKTKDC